MLSLRTRSTTSPHCSNIVLSSVSENSRCGKESWVRKSRLPMSRNAVHRGAFSVRVKNLRLLSVVSTMRPPGASTRASSRSPRTGSSRCSIAWRQSTSSNSESANGRRSMFARSRWTSIPPRSAASAAVARMLSAMSTPTSRPGTASSFPMPARYRPSPQPASRSDVTGRNAGNSSMRTENLRSRVGSGATGTVYCSAPRRSYTSRRWSDGAAVVMRARQAYSGNLRRGRIAQTDNVAA